MEYKYSIVSFIKRGRQGKTKSVDIVPSSWLMWDDKKKKCVTKFPDPPYTEETSNSLHARVKKDEEPSDDWPVHSVQLKGEARTYSEAVTKLSRLEKSEHAFSLDEGDTPSDKERCAEEAVKRRKLMEKTKAIKSIMEVKQLNAELPLTTENCRMEPVIIETGTFEWPRQFCSPVDPTFKIANKDNDCFKAIKENLRRMEEAANNAEKKNDANFKRIADVLSDTLPSIIHNLDDLKKSIMRQETKLNSILDKKMECFSNTDNSQTIEIPYTNYEDFNKFNKCIENNNTLKEYTFQLLKTCVDKDFKVSRSSVNMLKKFLSKDLAVKFTAQKKISDKFILKDTNFYKLMKDVIVSTRLSIGFKTDDKEVCKEVGLVLANARDWYTTKSTVSKNSKPVENDGIDTMNGSGSTAMAEDDGNETDSIGSTHSTNRDKNDELLYDLIDDPIS